MDDRLRQLITLGREQYQAGEYHKAEYYLRQVVTEHQGFADIYNMLGVIYHSQGRFDDAERAFERALEINPGYTEVALNLAVTYNDRGKYREARDVYTSAMARSKTGPASLDRFARGKIANMHADLGAVYTGFGRHEDAVREYQKALELCPDFVDLKTRLGNVYREMGEFDAALEQFRKVKELNPTYLPARISLGVTLFSMERRGDAIAEWKEALEQDPDNKNIQLYLRMVKDDSSDREASP